MAWFHLPSFEHEQQQQQQPVSRSLLRSLTKKRKVTPITATTTSIATSNTYGPFERYIAQKISHRIAVMFNRKHTPQTTDFIYKLMESASRPRHAEDYTATLAVLACEYIERFIAATTITTRYNASFFALVSAAYVLAINQMDDYLFSNKAWAKRVGVSLKELNHMQVEICKQLEWKLFVSPHAFELQFQAIVDLEEDQLNL